LESAPAPPREVGADPKSELPSRMPTMHGLGPASRASSGKLRLLRGGNARLRVDENLEESAFFERGDDSEVLGPLTSDRDADSSRAVSSIESVRRRAALRKVVAGVLGFASVIAALAAVKAMASPARGSLEPTPEPTEPIVVVMQRLDAVVSPAAGSRAPQASGPTSRAPQASGPTSRAPQVSGPTSSLAVPSADGLVCRTAAQCEMAVGPDDGAETSDEVGAAPSPPSANPSKTKVRRHLALGHGKNHRPHRPVRNVAPR
jgi:hypothetical protein